MHICIGQHGNVQCLKAGVNIAVNEPEAADHCNQETLAYWMLNVF